MSRHVTWQRVIALSAALLVLILSTGIASADSDVGYSGTVGKHHLRDSSAKPGVKCRYQEGGGSGEQVLYQLVVKPPVVFAVNDTAARDAQKVGWRIMVQRRNHGAASFVTIAQSSIKTATAFDDAAASFSSRTVPVISKFGADFRVHIQMLWYAANGTTVSGWAIHEVDWYRKIFRSVDYGNDVRTLHNYCGDYYVM